MLATTGAVTLAAWFSFVGGREGGVYVDVSFEWEMW